MPGFALRFAVSVLVTGLLVPGHLLAQSNTPEKEALLWGITEESGSSDQYEYYLERYPNGICSDLAQRRLEEAKSWENIKNTYSTNELEVYVKNNPNSIFAKVAFDRYWRLLQRSTSSAENSGPLILADDLRRKIGVVELCDIQSVDVADVMQAAMLDASLGTREQQESLVWTNADESGLPDKYQNYLERFPNGICSDLAQRHLEEAKSWEGIQDSYSTNELEAYIRDNPNSRFAEAAVDRLAFLARKPLSHAGNAVRGAEIDRLRRGLNQVEQCDIQSVDVADVMQIISEGGASILTEKPVGTAEMTTTEQPTPAVAPLEESSVIPATELGQRLALVIGNGSYIDAPLINPQNDAQLMGRTLSRLGFAVSLLNNLNQAEMKRAIVDFGVRLEDSGSNAVGLFYFAGHGVQLRGKNYLIPVDAEIRRQADVDIFAVDASSVLDQMFFARNPMNIVILDACRNNPYTRNFRDATRGLARMEAPRGTIVAYSTKPGDTASDGDGRYSPYTKALTDTMQIPGLSLSNVFIQTRVAVMAATDERQVPWEEGGLTANFYFRPVAAAAPVSVPNVEDGISRAETFDDLKNKCGEIGFEPGTEKFGDCVMRLME